VAGTGSKAGLIAIAILCCVTPAWAQCGVYKTWAPNEILTSSDMNLAFQRTVDANTPICSKGYSASIPQMQITTDPFPSGAESQATTMAGELERLRFQIKALVGKAQWYHRVDNSMVKGVPKDFGATYTLYAEIADPAPPAVDTLALYAKDDGAGNTVLAYEDHNGVVNTLTGPSSSFGNGVMVNLQIQNNPGTPNTKIDVTADRISIGGFIKPALNVTIDAAGTGANGLDSGALANDTLYYVFLIYRPTVATFAGLLSTSETAPALPSGYTRKRLLGAVRTDSSANFVAGVQHDALFSYAATQCATTVPVGGPSSVSFSSCIPVRSASSALFTFQYPNVAGAIERRTKMGSVSFTGGATNFTAPVSFTSPASDSFANPMSFGPFLLPLINGTTRSSVFVEQLGDSVVIRVAGWTMSFTDP
jgi:hypothetical protein